VGYGPVDIGTQGTMSLTTTITKGTQSVLRTFAGSLLPTYLRRHD
jgi:hypothetical protein